MTYLARFADMVKIYLLNNWGVLMSLSGVTSISDGAFTLLSLKSNAYVIQKVRECNDPYSSGIATRSERS